MTENKPGSQASSLDPADDAPEFTDVVFDVAEFRVGDKVIRPATGYLGPNGVVRGRPPSRGRAKQEVTLRLDADVIEKFRAEGPGWQGRMKRRCGRRRGCKSEPKWNS